MSIAEDGLWADLCRLAARRDRRVEIMREHAGVADDDELPRCRPRRRRRDVHKDKVVYPTEVAAEACCAALLAELGDRQYPYSCPRRRAGHWHLTSQQG